MILKYVLKRRMNPMSNSDATIVNGIEIDNKKARALMNWLLITEKKNIKSKEKNDHQMISEIQKKIEEVVQCY